MEDTVQFSDADLEALRTVGLEKKVRALFNALEELQQKKNELENENKNLKLRIAKFKKQSTPPHILQTKYSLNLTKTKSVQSVWKKSIKKDTIPIDETIEIPTVDICSCGSTQFTILRTGKKITQDIRLRRNNICYIKKDKKCGSCGKIYKATTPQHLKGRSFGQELRTLISYLKFKCRITQPLLHNFLTEIGITISKGEISYILLENGKKLIPAYTQLRTWGIKNASYLQTDATGHKFKSPYSGKIINHYMHFLGNDTLSLFKITPRYNSAVMNTLLTTRGKRKPLVCDDGGANGARLLITKKQLCWIHEIRHYLKLNPVLTIHNKKLQEVLAQWYALYKAALSYKDIHNKNIKQTILKQFDLLVSQTTGYAALDQRLALTKKKKSRLFLFLHYPYLPIHNNQAERDLRAAVIIRKISHETKSLAGSRSLERHLSVIHTAQKLKLNTLQTLDGLLTSTLSPFVLTTHA